MRTVELSPREEQLIGEVREIMEAKLVWYLMVYDDMKIELIEDTDGWGLPYFSFYLTTQFQKYDVVNVYIKQEWWRDLEYEVNVNIKESKKYRFERIDGLRKFIMEELT